MVNHSEKMDLVVQSDKDLLSEDADWEKMMGDFTAQINENAKGAGRTNGADAYRRDGSEGGEGEC